MPILMLLSCNCDFIDLLKNSLPWSTHPYLVWFTTRFIQNFLKCTGVYNTFFVFQRNNASVIATYINNTLQESNSFVVFVSWQHVCKISTRSVFLIKWVYFKPSNFSSGRFMYFIGQFLVIRDSCLCISSLLIKKFVDHWC